jgi:type II secretory pathway component PulK
MMQERTTTESSRYHSAGVSWRPAANTAGTGRRMDRWSYYEAVYRFATERQRRSYQEGQLAPEEALLSVMTARGYHLGATFRTVNGDNTWRNANPHAASLYDAMVADHDTDRRWQRNVVEAHGFRYFDTRYTDQ